MVPAEAPPAPGAGRAVDVAGEAEERILDAALSCFAAGGIRRTTMNQIAQAAGLGVATIYRRFARKEHLAQAVLLRETKRFIEEVDAKISQFDTMEAQLAEGFAAFIGGVARRPLLRQLIDSEAEIMWPLVTEQGGSVLALGRRSIAAIIRRWQEAGVIADFDADLVAEIFARLAESLVITPEGLIPTGDEVAARRFAHDHLVPLLRPRAS